MFLVSPCFPTFANHVKWHTALSPVLTGVTGTHASHPVWAHFSPTCWSDCQLCHHIDHLNSTNNPSLVIVSTLDVFFNLFSAPLSPPSITLHCNTSLLFSTSQSRKKIKGVLMSFISFCPSVFHCFTIRSSQIIITVDNIVRIYQNTNEKQTISCSLREAHGHIVLARGLCGRGLVVSNPGSLGHWKPAAWRNKTFKVLSVTLHFQPYINICRLQSKGTLENISCYLKQTAFGLQLRSKCRPPASSTTWKSFVW